MLQMIPTNETLCRPSAVAEVLNNILKAESRIDQDKEHLWVIGFDTGLKVKYIDLVGLGILNTCPTHPREVFRVAIHQGVNSIIIGHNHPGGRIDPSRSDIEMTQQMRKAAEILGIHLHDHIIIDGQGGYYSFTEQGM